MSPGSTQGRDGTCLRRLRIGIVSSVGGHLSEVLQLRPALDQHDCFYILNAPKVLPDFMKGRTYFIAHAERDPLVLWNLVECYRILRLERPDVLVSFGAGPAVPAFAVGKMLGIRRIFVESFCAIRQPSLTGRLIHDLRLANLMFYQWPYLAESLPRAKYGGIVYSPPQEPWPRAPAEGPVFVTVGNALHPFDRMLRMAEEALRQCNRTDVVWQVGHCRHRPAFGAVHHFLEPAAFKEVLRKASALICHAGAGSVMEAVTCGHRPVVVARRASFGEHVNDHQLELTTELSRLGWVVAANTAAEIVEALELKRPLRRLTGTVPTMHAAFTKELLRCGELSLA